MSIRRLVWFFVLLTTVICGCAPALVPDDVAKLRWVETADPIADAKSALANGDMTLIAVNGYTWSIPGVSEKDKPALRQAHGVRFMEGTGDVHLNPEHDRLIKQAAEYAAAYNRYLLSHLHDK